MMDATTNLHITCLNTLQYPPVHKTVDAMSMFGTAKLAPFFSGYEVTLLPGPQQFGAGSKRTPVHDDVLFF